MIEHSVSGARRENAEGTLPRTPSSFDQPQIPEIFPAIDEVIYDKADLAQIQDTERIVLR